MLFISVNAFCGQIGMGQKGLADYESAALPLSYNGALQNGCNIS
jgi:hypothetical protein